MPDNGLLAMSHRSRPFTSAIPHAAGSSGFTILELLITISIAVTLLTIGAPSFIQFLQDRRVGSQASDLTLSLQYAKSEAIKRNLRVSLCATAGAATACTTGTAWTNGWNVMTDDNGNCTQDGNDQVLRVWPALEGGNTLCFNGGNGVTFRSSGMTPAANGTFRICDARGPGSARGIVISNQGRTRAGTVAACP